VSDTIRWQIISNIYSFMSRIRRSLAYRTEIGKNPYLLRRSPQAVPCIAVFPGREEVTREYKDSVLAMSVRVEGIVEVGDDDPVEVSELILADIIEGMTGQRWVLDYTSGGQNKPQVGDLVEGQESGAVGVMESYTTGTGAWADGDAEGTLILRRKIGEYVAEDLDIGSEINLATTDGSISHSSAEALVTGDLADDIVYLEGGIEEFPDSDQVVIGSSAMFNIIYRMISGNPYYQPS
jgi:hypothetical protein